MALKPEFTYEDHVRKTQKSDATSMILQTIEKGQAGNVIAARGVFFDRLRENSEERYLDAVQEFERMLDAPR